MPTDKMSGLKQLNETETRVLQRLAFEIGGYNALIREFTTADVEFQLDDAKWSDLHRRRNQLIALQQEMLSRLCGQGYTGMYEIDFATGELRWG